MNAKPAAPLTVEDSSIAWRLAMAHKRCRGSTVVGLGIIEFYRRADQRDAQLMLIAARYPAMCCFGTSVANAIILRGRGKDCAGCWNALCGTLYEDAHGQIQKAGE